MTEMKRSNPVHTLKLLRMLPGKTLAAALILMLPAGAFASDSMVSVNVSVTAVANNCRINENNPVTVEFGTVRVPDLASVTASVPVAIACDITPSGTVSMKIQGTVSSFDSHALATNVTGLGIVLSSSGATQNRELDLNTFYDVTTAFGLTSKTGTFNLTATLASDETATLSGGEFNASATLVLQMS